VLHVGGGMLKTVRKVLGPGHPEVEDVTQDAILALLSSLAGFRGDCTVAHFAHRVALLTALAARRRLRTRDRWTEFEAAPEAIPDERGGSPLSRAISGRRRLIVRQLLDELSEPLAEALALHFILGYTVEEIAATAAVPANTVWSRLRLGKQALRRKLGRDARMTELLQMRE
jgi:RNA polymerase sigma factor (sigma-70 family)